MQSRSPFFVRKIFASAWKDRVGIEINERFERDRRGTVQAPEMSFIDIHFVI